MNEIAENSRENVSHGNTSMNNTFGDYYYYYDYEESVNNIPIEEIVPVAIVYGLTLILGVVGNTLVIVSILRIRRMRNVTNIFLMSLASADLVLVLICVPIKVRETYSHLFNVLRRVDLVKLLNLVNIT